jgi:hypothetical protein
MTPSFGQIVASYVATYGAPLVGYVVLRVLTVSLTLHLMMRRTAGVADGAPVAAGESSGLRTGDDLTFFELDAAKGILLNDPYEHRLERAMQTGSRTWNILWQSFFAYAFIATTVLIGFLISKANPGNDPQLILPFFFGGLLIFGLILFFVTGNRYRSIRRVPFVTPVACVLIMAVISAVGGRVLEMPFYLYLLPIFWPAIVVVRGFGEIRRGARQEGNLRLLILRVFGSDRNTSFVFGPLMRSWQFLGSFFTVVDPSYIRYQSSLSSAETRWKLLRLFFAYGVFISALSFGASSLIGFLSATHPRLAALQSLSRMQQQELIGMLAWLILIPLAVLPTLFLVKERFIRNLATLEGRVRAAEQQTGGWSGVFKGFPMYCYDNIWKRAVNRLLATSDVVLMDLRGFTPARAGCEYEVGVLIDQYPVKKIIFLVDQAETKKDVYELIRRRWMAMDAASPNRELRAPIVKTYAPGDEEKRDIPRILALLAASADKSDGDGNAMVSFEGTRPQRSRDWVPAKPKSSLRRLPGRVLESLDMAVSNPRVAAVVIPVMLLAVLSLLYLRMRPVIQSFQAVATPKMVSVAEPAPAPKETSLSAAGMRSDARASISSIVGMDGKGRTYSEPIEVSVDLTGGAAAEAYRYGNINVTSATDAAGASLEELKTGFGEGRSESGFSVIDHSATDFFTNQPDQPAGGLRLKLRFFQPKPTITHVGNLAGNVTMQMPDPEKMVRIENAGAQMSIPGNVQLNNPKFAALGNVSMVVSDHDRDHVQVIIESKNEDFSVRLVDATGTVHFPQVTSRSGDSLSFAFPLKDGAMANTRLEIIWGYRSIEVPFQFKNIEIKKAADGSVG